MEFIITDFQLNQLLSKCHHSDNDYDGDSTSYLYSLNENGNIIENVSYSQGFSLKPYSKILFYLSKVNNTILNQQIESQKITIKTLRNQVKKLKENYYLITGTELQL